MEIFDLYDKYRRKTGKTHERGVPIKEGDYHNVVHVWIVNDKGEYLIQKRQSWKIGWPNMWDGSAAGSVILGETSKEAAIRETKEELGIDLDISNGNIVFTVKFSFGFDDIWLVKQNVAIDELKLQYEEVADAKWVIFEEIKEMAKKGDFIEYHYLDCLNKIANSKIVLTKASSDEAEELLSMQKEVFKPFYEKYQDHDTSPVTQTIDKFLRRFDIGDYYKIMFQGNLAGGVFVYEKELGKMRLHIINIRQEYQNIGIAQEIIKRLEQMYPQADSWELDTILTEKRNCYLYEKMGYVQSGELQPINDKLTLISYKKEVRIEKIEGL